MQRRIGIKVSAIAVVLGIALALVSACGGGVAQEDYDAVQQQLSAKEQEVTSLQEQLQAAEAAGQGTAALQQQLDAKEAELAALRVKNPLIWTEVRPTPTPRPPATPVPPGYVAPTPVPPDAAWVNEVLPFTFYVEHLTGHQTSQIAQFPSCVPNSQFSRGAHIVWRFEVVDTFTGKRVTSLDSPSPTIKVVLPNGEEKASRYSKRGGIGPWMWSAAWDVPADYPLGTLDYQIVVTKGGRTGTFDQDTLALVRPPATPGGPAVSDSRLQIVP